MTTPLLELEHLDVAYGSGQRAVCVVHDISLGINAGEALGIVGESGSGKSTIGRAILGLSRPVAGRILFEGRDITNVNRKERQKLSTDIQVVFQDPRSSLNEAKKIRDILTEPVVANKTMSKRASLERAAELLDNVGLNSDAMDKLPGSFSGGQRQRIAIARAFMPSPRLVVCDEPVSALDLSVQAHIMNLFRKQQSETGVAYLFIAHDLAVVRVLCDRVMVMSAGHAVETGPTDEVYSNPSHDYTKRLLAAEPHPDPAIQRERRKKWESLAMASTQVNARA
ncbi:ATP-binding cassette domain-containing protein [Rhodococcoides kyotonense]|uniref:ABC transporter n=1 Tax=Rhodococcoides kyotonense TaxID=398843 RepID=A0A239MYH1_9NOCA|nr:ATP-binding cassette domain-containing protein [Rhodococcus kyotonensis]SNT47837.1 ABC transporter [Rhodococcus kyotonensis]